MVKVVKLTMTLFRLLFGFDLSLNFLLLLHVSILREIALQFSQDKWFRFSVLLKILVAPVCLSP
jgi:hypothetical protein